MALVLHDNARSSNAQKVRFLLAELGVAYARREVPFGLQRPRWHLDVNPVGGIPALVDGDVVLAESNTILRYLALREGREDLYPQPLTRRARVDWLLDATSMTLRELTRPIEEQAFGLRRGRGLFAEPPDHDKARALLASQRPRLAAYAALLDPAGAYAIGGAFTIVDAAAAPFLFRLTRAGLDLTGLERLAVWSEAVNSRPAWVAMIPDTGV
jgi:glutathione S-transferase